MFEDVNWAKRVWLLLLLLVWTGLLFGGFLFSLQDSIPLDARMSSSLTLVVAGWSWYLLVRDTRVFRLLIAIGMTFGFIGDLAMAGLLGQGEFILGGIAAFGCGHLAYMGAFVYLSERQRLNAPAPRWGALAAWLLVGLIAWSTIVFPSFMAAPQRWAALPYTLLLASTAGLATGLAWQAPPFRLLALGTGLFLLSDLILAKEHFGQFHHYWLGSAVWLTYGPGQMLIVYGANAALGEIRKTLEENGSAASPVP